MAGLTGRPLVFIDTETTGLNTFTDDIWEIAGIRRDDMGDSPFQMFIQHDADKAAALPPRYFDDYRGRFDQEAALTPVAAADRLIGLCAGPAVMVGANVAFDMHLIERMLRGCGHDTMPWDYHLLDVEAFAVGHMAGNVEVPWKSDALAERSGLRMRDDAGDPVYRRHTAADDARWVRDWYDTIAGTPAPKERPHGARRTAIPEARCVELRANGRAAASQSRYVDPQAVFAAVRIIGVRGEQWAAAILGRDLSRRSLSDSSLPYLMDGESETILAADRDEDRYAIAHLDTGS